MTAFVELSIFSHVCVLSLTDTLRGNLISIAYCPFLIYCLLDCPEDVPHRCLDNSLCFSEEQKCDTVENCKDASDESSAFCRKSKVQRIVHECQLWIEKYPALKSAIMAYFFMFGVLYAELCY